MIDITDKLIEALKKSKEIHDFIKGIMYDKTYKAVEICEYNLTIVFTIEYHLTVNKDDNLEVDYCENHKLDVWNESSDLTNNYIYNINKIIESL